MLNLKKLFQVDKSQVATSKLEKLHQSQNWEKLSDTETESIQGGNYWPPVSGVYPFPGSYPYPGGWNNGGG